MKKPRYTGKLSQPILRTPSPTFEGAVTPRRVAKFSRVYRHHARNADRQQRKEEAEKIKLLAQLFRVGSKAFKELALELARAHVPGFRVKLKGAHGRGRKRKWDGPMLLELIKVVDEVKGKHTSFNDRLALKHIATKSPYKEQWGAPANHKGTTGQWIETLESRLQDAKKYSRYLDDLPKLFSDLQKQFRKCLKLPFNGTQKPTCSR
jgi:hypothetical protein